MYKRDRAVLQVSVGPSMDPRSAGLVCALHRILPNLCMGMTWGFETHVCLRLCSRAHLCVCSHPSHGRGGCAGPPSTRGLPSHAAVCASRAPHAGLGRLALPG